MSETVVGESGKMNPAMHMYMPHNNQSSITASEAAAIVFSKSLVVYIEIDEDGRDHIAVPLTELSCTVDRGVLNLRMTASVSIQK